jgi:hypothetical protein
MTLMRTMMERSLTLRILRGVQTWMGRKAVALCLAGKVTAAAGAELLGAAVVQQQQQDSRREKGSEGRRVCLLGCQEGLRKSLGRQQM